MLKTDNKLLLLISLSLLGETLSISMQRVPDNYIRILADWLLDGAAPTPEELNHLVDSRVYCPHMLDIAYCYSRWTAEAVEYFNWINFHYLQSVVVLKFIPMHDWLIVRHWLNNSLESLYEQRI
jgi:hypothetical protein